MRALIMVLGATLSVANVGAQSQYVIRAPYRDWRTVETTHWSVHYPVAAAAFAECLVPKLESIYTSTAAIVGYSTTPRITLVIDDANASSGAFASANARAPVIVLQTQPSSPRSSGYSDCTTARVVHELTHVLQLSRPWGSDHSRWMLAFVSILPAEPGPVIAHRKAWLREAYAEYVKGQLTPLGGQYLTAAPNAVRGLALIDRLPAYDQLDNSSEGRYLVGAAFVNWLAARSDSALPRLWPRMASADWRGEAAEFTSLFGAPPESLYAHFIDQVKATTRAVSSRFQPAGLVRGTRVRDVGYADNITVASDGAHFAGVLGWPVARATIWPAFDTAAAPATLPIPTGQSPSALRYMPGGKDLLAIHWEMIDGAMWRPDLYVWNLERRSLRRVTHGAGIRDADPMPDGRAAVSTRCEYGVCDVVRVDLATGVIRVIAHGSPSLAFDRPRVSRDGKTIAVAVQSGARSRVALIDEATGSMSYADPDDGAWRYEPAFLADGRLVVVSDASGIPNIEILDPQTRHACILTRVMNAAYAPEPDPAGNAIYYLRQTPASAELRHIRLDEAVDAPLDARDSALGPSAPIPLPASPPPAFVKGPVPVAHSYGLGPRWFSVLPGFSFSPDGNSASAMLWTSDIIGRLSVMVRGTYGTRAMWRGGNVAAVWRGMRTPLFVDAAVADQQSGPTSVYRGISARVETEYGPWAHRQHVGFALSGASVASDNGGRAMALAEYGISRVHVSDWYVAGDARITLSGGRTASTDWTRALVDASVTLGHTNGASVLRVRALYGSTSQGAPAFEQFTLGGTTSPVIDRLTLSQRVLQPLMAAGTARGQRVGVLQATGPRVGPVTPFVWVGSAGGELRSWSSVVGVGRTFSDDPRRNWRVPGAQLSGGIGYRLNAPGGRGLAAHLSLTFTQ
jgi:hypothetical protein